MAGTTEMVRGDAYILATELMLLPLMVLAMLFLYVTGAYFFGPEWPASGALMYIVMVLAALALAQLTAGVEPEATRASYLRRLVPTAPALEGVFHWVAGFAVTWAAVLGIFWALGYESTITAPAATAMFIFTVFFVAPAEEVLFRGVLPNLNVERHLLGRVPVLLVGSQVVFTLFHVAAYGGVGSPMIMTFILAMVWVVVARRTSLFVTMGSHVAWNGCILGILSGGVV